MAPGNARILPTLVVLAITAVIVSPPVLPASSAGAAELDPADSYRLSLLRLKAHLGVARTLLQLGADGAAYHLRGPMREIVGTIETELEDRGAPLSSSTLDELERVTGANRQTALATVDLAAAAIDGSFAQTGALDGESALLLSERLVREAVQLYADAVEDHEVVDLQRYRTGRGYVIQAEALVRNASGLRGRPGHDDLVSAVVLIRQSWPGVNPPPIVFDPASVSERLDQALSLMEQLR